VPDVEVDDHDPGQQRTADDRQRAADVAEPDRALAHEGEHAERGRDQQREAERQQHRADLRLQRMRRGGREQRGVGVVAALRRRERAAGEDQQRRRDQAGAGRAAAEGGGLVRFGHALTVRSPASRVVGRGRDSSVIRASYVARRPITRRADAPGRASGYGRRVAAVHSLPLPPRATLAVVVVVVGTFGLVEVADSAEYQPTERWLAALAGTVVLLPWLRRAPLVVLLGLLALHMVVPLEERGAPAFQFFSVLIACFATGLYAPPRAGAAALSGVAAYHVLVAALRGGSFEHWGEAVTTIAFDLAAWGVALLLRARARRTAELEAEAARLEADREERARAAVADERARIARELHDAVAHSVSVMVLQSGAVRRALRSDQERERDALLSVERTGRQAVGELQRMLGILRRPGQGPELGPQPSVARVEELVDAVREAGLDVELAVEGAPRPLSPGLDLSAYRIVQEALTNALKHAAGARVRVRVAFGSAELRLDVVDDGPGAANGRAADGGHGLVGMRERVAVWGGTLDAGPAPGGGYRVLAHLPYGDAS
jgi:signal transduction histidine kinase